MGRKAGSSTGTGSTNLTLRMAAQTGAWLYATAHPMGQSLSERVVGLLDDVRTWWHMSPSVVEMLQKDRRSLEMTEDEYLRYLLTRRCREIAKRGPGFDREDLDVELTKGPV